MSQQVCPAVDPPSKVTPIGEGAAYSPPIGEGATINPPADNLPIGQGATYSPPIGEGATIEHRIPIGEGATIQPSIPIVLPSERERPLRLPTLVPPLGKVQPTVLPSGKELPYAPAVDGLHVLHSLGSGRGDEVDYR
ncbi:hypothetical protein AB1N83_010769 [Pleurotus pulmonarius]